MEAGRLRHRITIEERSGSTDSMGQVTYTWSTLATVWAQVRMAGAGERFVSGADTELAQVSHRINIRYRDDVTTLNRVIHDGRTLDIHSAIDPEGRQREMLLLCREVIGQADG